MMSEEENKLIRAQFQNLLNKLIDSKIAPTGTAILEAEQPLILLFDEVMYKLERQQEKIEKLKQDKKDNIQVVYGGRRFGTEGMVVKDYISKDKIRQKIREFEQTRNIIANEENQNLNYDMKRNDYCVAMLNDLLEE